MFRLRTRLLVGIGALVLLGAACAKDSSDAGSDGVDDGGVAAATTTATGATGATGGAGASDDGGYQYGAGGGGGYGGGGSKDNSSGGTDGEVALTVTTVNFAFSPGEFSVPSGSKIEIDNSAPETPHTFTVVGTDIDVALDPGATEDATIDLEPGIYDVICQYHESSGMTATLTVT